MSPSPHDPKDRRPAPGDALARGVGDQVRTFLDFIVREPSEELSAITESNKRKIVGEILSDVAENVAKQAPVLCVRRRLTNFATLTVMDEVLTNTPQEAGFPGVTGMLGPRLPELASVNPRLREFFGSGRAKPHGVDQMADLLRARGIVFNLWARAYNVARIELGDWDRDKKLDWFAPYKATQAILCEFAYRRELGMPSNLPSKDERAGVPAEFMAYAEFEKAVLEGHGQPRLVWEEKWEADLGRPCPFKGREF